MKAIVQDGYGSADVLHLREIDRPTMADDDVLVRVHAASINAADSHFTHLPALARVFFGLRKPKVAIRGWDVAGSVEAVGKHITRFKSGDEVFGCAKGSFAEYANAKEENMAAMPRGLTFAQAAAVPVAALTALQGLRDKARLQPGQRVLIYGAGGGVGTFAVQVAKALGAHVTAATSPRNVDVIRALAPDEMIDYTREDFVQRGQRYDVFFDIAANRPLSDCLRVLVPKGVFVGVGGAKRNAAGILTRILGILALNRVRSQRMLFFVARVRHDDLVTLSGFIEAGKLAPVIDREYALSATPEAMRYVASGQARAKVVLNVI
jgi:NADPH:quinone reductase-like Zn-dependent oxidoreductase